jgi:hypothetical protein
MRSREPRKPPVPIITLADFATYSRELLEGLSTSARAFDQPQLAQLLDIAVAEVMRIGEETQRKGH